MFAYNFVALKIILVIDKYFGHLLSGSPQRHLTYSRSYGHSKVQTAILATIMAAILADIFYLKHVNPSRCPCEAIRLTPHHLCCQIIPFGVSSIIFLQCSFELSDCVVHRWQVSHSCSNQDHRRSQDLELEGAISLPKFSSSFLSSFPSFQFSLPCLSLLNPTSVLYSPFPPPPPAPLPL
jgi:hypothetical protein